MNGGLAPLTRPQRFLLAAGLMALLVAGLALWRAYGLPVALTSGGMLC
ncbi:hypothetical protein [Paracoccus zhejiangensis]|nr:hypothetical protein [Paracoccus zhejiangensis]